MFFHGWPSCRLQGELSHRSAQDCQVRLICPDRPGIGQSSRQDGRKLSDWPPLVERLARHLNLEAYSILGVSGGGPYAIACASAISAKSLFRTAAVCSAPPLTDPADHQQIHSAYQGLIRLHQRRAWLLPTCLHFGKWLTSRPERSPITRQLIKQLNQPDRSCIEEHGISFAKVCEAFHEAMRSGSQGLIQDSKIYLQPWNINFEQIHHLSIWHGQSDDNLPWQLSQKLADRIPQAETHWFPNEGHYSLPLNHAHSIFRKITP